MAFMVHYCQVTIVNHSTLDYSEYIKETMFHHCLALFDDSFLPTVASNPSRFEKQAV